MTVFPSEPLIEPERTTLKRSLGLPAITLYGLGTIVGGGFYGLVGKVAAEADVFAPLAFVFASVIALFSALSFAELSSRFPYSAGEAHYALEAFGRKWFSATVGWMVIVTGVVSAATLADLFAGFVRSLIGPPIEWTFLLDNIIIVLMVMSLGLIAAWGITESAVFAVIITILEVGGLIYVFFCASGSLSTVGEKWESVVPSFSLAHWSCIAAGAYLSFYSFVGFEDMVNLAEEVKRPQRNLPIAILASLGITTIIYFAVSLVTVLSVPKQQLVQSETPLSLVVGGTGAAAAAITTIGMFAGLNGALVQIVMATRVTYGLAMKGGAPHAFCYVHPKTRTPLTATFAVIAAVMLLSLCFYVVSLAKATSTILLAVYAIVNLALWRIKRREHCRNATQVDVENAKVPTQPDDKVIGWRVPIWFPVVGFVLCTGFVMFEGISLISTSITTWPMDMDSSTGMWFWTLGLSGAACLLSLVLLPIIVIYIPADLFHRPSRSDLFTQQHPIVRLALKSIKNVIGAGLVLAGIIMLLTPGQGLLTILIGLLVIDLPGKHHLVRRILARPNLLRTINRIRKKAGRRPVEPPDPQRPI